MTQMPTPRVFSGIQPTGEIHIGNYFGAIENWVRLQDQYECFFAIVDYHAITVPYDADTFPQLIEDAAVSLLAAGLDPEKCHLFLQSEVPEHLEHLHRVRALNRQIVHVERLVEEDAGRLPRPLLVAPVRELRRHTGIDVRPRLCIAEQLDRVLCRRQQVVRLGVLGDGGWFFTPGRSDVLSRNAFHVFATPVATRPAWTVKFSRIPGRPEAFDRDQRGLELARLAGERVPSHAPRLLGRLEMDGLHASVETVRPVT